MPNLSAAKKALRVSQRRRIINIRWKRKMHDRVKEFRDLLRAGNNDEAATLYPKVASVLDRAAQRNIIHRNTAARKKARLARTLRTSITQTKS